MDIEIIQFLIDLPTQARRHDLILDSLSIVALPSGKKPIGHGSLLSFWWRDCLFVQKDGFDLFAEAFAHTSCGSSKMVPLLLEKIRKKFVDCEQQMDLFS